MRLIARGGDPAKDQSYMLATVDPALLDRVAFPLGAQGKRSTRDEAAAAGLAVAERAESQEACFLAGGDYRAFLERQGLAPQARPDRRRARRRARSARRRLALHAGAAPRNRPRVAGAALRAARSTPPRTRSPSGLGARSRCASVEVRGRLYLPVERAEAKLRYRSDAVPAAVEVDGGRVSRSVWSEPAGRRRAGPGGRALRRRRDRGSGRHHRRNRVGSPR